MGKEIHRPSSWQGRKWPGAVMILNFGRGGLSPGGANGAGQLQQFALRGGDLRPIRPQSHEANPAAGHGEDHECRSECITQGMGGGDGQRRRDCCRSPHRARNLVGWSPAQKKTRREWRASPGGAAADPENGQRWRGGSGHQDGPACLRLPAGVGFPAAERNWLPVPPRFRRSGQWRAVCRPPRG